MVRNKAWLRAVASLDCQRCGAGGPVQAAHANWAVYGKGMAQKAHDVFTAALCQPCHHSIDAGARMSGEERREAWEAAWRKTLVALCESGRVKAR